MTSALPNRVWLWGFVPWISTEYSTEYDSEHLVPTPYSVLLDLRELNCEFHRQIMSKSLFTFTIFTLLT